MLSEQSPITSPSRGTNDVTVRAENLSKCYHIFPGNRARLRQAFFPKKKYYEEFWALTDISFEVRRGEAFGIIGRNGAGKSTLLQILARILKPTTGVVEMNGRISAILELGAGFDPQYTGRENAYMNGAIMGLSRREMDERINNIRDFADIGEFFDRPIWMYSSGMSARLAFAVAINVDPEILIVDEVLSVGDIMFQRKCSQKIERLMEKGITILFVSHNLGMVENICGRAMFLDEGKVEKMGMTSTVIQAFQAATGEPISMPEDDTAHAVDTETASTDDDTAAAADEADSTEAAGAIGTDSPHKGLSVSSYYQRMEVLPFYDQLKLNKTILFDESIRPLETAEVAITRITLRNAEGKITTDFHCKDKMIVEIEYFAERKLSNPAVGFSLFNSHGLSCLGARTLMSGVSTESFPIDEIEGEGKIAAEIEELRLTAGEYLLQVSIIDSLLYIPYGRARSARVRVRADAWTHGAGVIAPIYFPKVSWRMLRPE